MNRDHSEKDYRIFRGLNALPWSDLTHAYGSAEEVPMWLRQLASPDQEVVEEAMHHLWGSICHQGWICPATAYAVPFLLELLSVPTVVGKAQILELLADITLADLELSEKRWRKNERVLQWNVPEHIPFKDAYQEVSKGISLYTALFEHEDETVRMHAVGVFACVAPPSPEYRSLLLSLSTREITVQARANLVLAIGKFCLSVPEELSFFDELMQTPQDEMLTFSAAVALARLTQEQASEQVAHYLAHIFFDDEPEALSNYHELPYSRETAWYVAGQALVALGAERLQFIIPAIPALFEQLESWSAGDLAELVVDMFFAGTVQEGDKQRTQEELTKTQWSVLSLLVEQKHIWASSNLSWRLQAYGLPDSQENLLTYLGRELPPPPPPVLPRVHPQTSRPRRDRISIFTDTLQERYPQVLVRSIVPGGKSDVVRINDEFIFHVPASREAFETMERDCALLRVLQGRLPLPLPSPLYTSEERGEVGQVFFGYRKLPGKPLYKEMYESIDGEEIQHLVASQLGSFFSALHRIPLAELSHLDLPVLSRRETYAALYLRVREIAFPHLDAASREETTAQFERFLDTEQHFPMMPVLIHGNVSPRALLYDAKARSLGGVIDWRSAGPGDPAQDLAWLFGPQGYGDTFTQQFASFYPELPALWDRFPFYRIVSAMQGVLSRLEECSRPMYHRYEVR